MITVALYKFTKKENSTAIPTGGSQTLMDVVFKSSVSFHNPVFLIEWEYFDSEGYTYLGYEDKYYYITDIVNVRNKLYEIHCKLDALATRRSKIMNSTQMIARSNVLVNDRIVDSFYPRLSNPVVENVTRNINWYDAGSYIMAIADGKGLKYYALSYGDFITLTQRLFAQSQDSLWDTIADAAKSIQRTFLNVMQYIISCHWTPLPFFNEAVGEEITLGYWPTGVIATPITAQSVIHPLGDSVTISIPNNAKNNFKWLNTPNYNNVTLHLPMCGNIQLDASQSLTVSVSMAVDIFGKIFYTVNHGSKIYRLTGDCGVPIALSSNAVSDNAPAGIVGMVGSIAGIVAGVNGGGVGMVVGGIVGAGASEAALIPEPQTTGSQAGFLAHKVDSNIILNAVEYDIPDDSSLIIGYPVMKMSKLTTSGFYIISNPVVDFGDYTENQEIKDYMEGGFYIE